jgi:hypothetical protein
MVIAIYFNERPPRLAASFILNRRPDVCLWHLADILEPAINVRFRGESGHRYGLSEGPRMTQGGQWLCGAAMVLMPVSAPIKVLV